MKPKSRHGGRPRLPVEVKRMRGSLRRHREPTEGGPAFDWRLHVLQLGAINETELLRAFPGGMSEAKAVWSKRRAQVWALAEPGALPWAARAFDGLRDECRQFLCRACWWIRFDPEATREAFALLEGDVAAVANLKDCASITDRWLVVLECHREAVRVMRASGGCSYLTPSLARVRALLMGYR